MALVYLVEQGAKVSLEQRRLIVEKDDVLICKVPFAHARALVIFGTVTLTTPVMKRLMSEGIDVIFLSVHGDYEGRLVGPLSGFGSLRQTQYQMLTDEAYRLAIAQQIVRGKCLNMRTFLMRYNRERHEPAIDVIIDRLAQMADKCQRTTKLSGLMGVEGASSAMYFSVLRLLLKHIWGFEKRQRRPPTDPVNVLLSFGYTLLAREMEASVSLVGLDPYIGALHTVEYGRPSLALDLIEEFRAITVDSVVLRCLNNHLISLKDFTMSDDPKRPVVLSDAGKRIFIKEWETRMNTEITHVITREKMIYRRVFEMQARLFARCLREKHTDYPSFLVR